MSTGNGEGGDRLIAGRYRLLSRLGRGGMGTVWRAEDELLNREVAVKEVDLRGERSAEERGQQRERTLREARAVAQVRHPSVVGIHDVVLQDGEPWIVMELVDGTSLGGRLSADGPMPPQEVAAMGLAVLSALEAAHARGVLHRDVKPDNVLLERDTERVVLTDFGIARMDGSVTLTEAGAFLGSPEFTAPERTAGGGAGPESDLWSVGVLLCTALEGRSPFRRDSMSGVLYAVLYEDIVLPARAEPLADVLRGLLQRDPARRITAVEASWLLTDYLERDSKGVSPTADTMAAAPAAAPVVPQPHRPAPGRTLAEEGPPDRTSVPSPTAAGATTDFPSGPGSTSAATSGSGSGREHGRGRTMLLGIAVVLAAGAVAAGGVLLYSQHTGSGDSAAGLHPQTSATATVSATAPATVRPSASATPTSAATPSPSPSRASGTVTAIVPAGYTMRHDQAGFSLVVPDGWQRSTDADGRIFYISPDQRFRIGVHPSSVVNPDGVLATLKRQVADGPKTYTDYHDGAVQPTVFHNTSDAALMQWTWSGYANDGFGARRVQDLSWTENGRTYDFWVSAPTTRLGDGNGYFQLLQSTFQAG